MRRRGGLIRFFVHKIKTLSRDIIEPIQIFFILRDDHVVTRLIDLHESFKHRALSLLHPLAHGMKIRWHDQRCRENAFTLLPFTFPKKLLEPFSYIKNIGIKRRKHLDFFALGIKNIAQCRITITGVFLQITNSVLGLGFPGSIHQTLNVHPCQSQRNKSYRRQYRKSSAHIIRNDKRTISIFIRNFT